MSKFFTDRVLGAIGAWQRGWREQQDRRGVLADELIQACSSMPAEFRVCTQTCFRKRFLHEGELVRIFLADQRDEGVVSWTTDRKVAEQFKGMQRPGAISGAIFEHIPNPEEVVLNIPRLWESLEFREAANSYQRNHGADAAALFHFADSQGEVVLTAPLRGSEVIALTGSPSSFDELCDRAGVPLAERAQLCSALLHSGKYPGGPQYLGKEGTKRAIENAIQRIAERIRSMS